MYIGKYIPWWKIYTMVENIFQYTPLREIYHDWWIVISDDIHPGAIVCEHHFLKINDIYDVCTLDVLFFPFFFTVQNQSKLDFGFDQSMYCIWVNFRDLFRGSSDEKLEKRIITKFFLINWKIHYIVSSIVYRAESC